jgi:RimJ/RimL family protein N-acetyltransferase
MRRPGDVVDDTGPVPHPYWPLFDLRVRTPRLELRIPDDDDLLALVDLVRHGIHDPASMPFSNPWTDVPSPDLERNALKWYWRQRAEWSKDDWATGFAVVVDGEVVGVQDLFAKDFLKKRVAESGSWIPWRMRSTRAYRSSTDGYRSSTRGVRMRRSFSGQ